MIAAQGESFAVSQPDTALQGGSIVQTYRTLPWRWNSSCQVPGEVRYQKYTGKEEIILSRRCVFIGRMEIDQFPYFVLGYAPETLGVLRPDQADFGAQPG